ncbi:uncharacterized protein JCM6883_000827 [Sporobolomyces salmoneus]|uniref:uncharacterized protein n=1 Tax=Sporobolomyces salmoneus TaxID=183962 RepID=UPI00316E6BA0
MELTRSQRDEVQQPTSHETDSTESRGHNGHHHASSSEPALVSPSKHDSHYAPGQHPHEIGHNPALPKDELDMEEKIK